MKRLLPFAFCASMLTAASAYANCPAGFTVDPSTGLGDEGMACHLQPFRAVSPYIDVFLVTGDNPEPEVTVTVNDGVLLSPAPGATTPRRSDCSAFPGDTQAEYAWGYAIPRWPDVFISQSSYDILGTTATISVRVRDVFHGFEPYSNYTLKVQCRVRLY